MKKISFCILSLCLVFCSSSFSQSGLPGTDIFLSNITVIKGKIFIDKPVNITRRVGYDNQPNFSKDGKKLLYVSILDSVCKTSDTARQAEVFEFVLKTAKNYRITSTAEDEYSPTHIPSEKCFSTVRVEKDSTQRLWKFCRKNGSVTEPVLIVPNIRRIGYHCWYGKHKLALWVLGDSLFTADASTGERKFITTKAGRCLQPLAKKSTFSYVDKSDSLNWRIKIYNDDKFSQPCVKGSEDYAWLPDGSIIMGSGRKLFIVYPEKNKEWQLLRDFSEDSDMPSFYRIAVSPDGDKIAFVAYTGKKP